jgi:hypothetical protein
MSIDQNRMENALIFLSDTEMQRGIDLETAAFAAYEAATGAS